MSSEALSIIYGLCSAVAWGAGDFSGGMASRQHRVLKVVLYSQAVGLMILGATAALMAESAPQTHHLILGGLAGISGGLGLIALYQGFAVGRMGIVAPLSAVLTAVIPIVFSFLVEGLPKKLQILGFGVAIFSVWLLSPVDSRGKIHLKELYLPLCAGLGFGLFFIFIDRVSEEAVLWPLVAARCASMILMVLLMTVRKQGLRPPKNRLFFIVLTGIFDVAGNTFFALASQTGRLDVSALLASLYPAATVVLAWVVLKERLRRAQWGGVCIALAALVLIAL